MTQRILAKVGIHAVEGKDLPQMDLGGSCDSVLQIVIGPNTRKTKPVMKSLNPVWNEAFEMEVYDLKAPVEFTVLDWDRLSRNDVVGHTKLNLASLPPGKNDLWLGMGQVKDKNPHIHVVVEILPRIHVRLVEGKELPTSDLFGGQSDPYVEFSHVKNVKRSNTIKKSLNPTWNEDFDFDIHDLSSPLMIQVFDWDLGSKSDLLGKCVVTLTSLKMGVNDVWVSLPTKGSIHLIIDALGFGTFDPQHHVQPIQQSQQNLQQNFEQLSIKKEEFVQMNTHVDTKPVVHTTVVTHTVSHDQKPVEHHTEVKHTEVKHDEHKGEHKDDHHKDKHHKDEKHKDEKHKDEKHKDDKHKDDKHHKDEQHDEHKKDKKDKKHDGDHKEKKEKKDKKDKKEKKDKKSGSSSDSSSDSD
jgi:hypothetical protein